MSDNDTSDKVMKHNPLQETDMILSEGFYGGNTATLPRKTKAAVTKKEKPTHYKVVCISLYTSDIAELEAKVAALKQRGFTKANKSMLLRLALRELDIDSVEVPSL